MAPQCGPTTAIDEVRLVNTGSAICGVTVTFDTGQRTIHPRSTALGSTNGR